MTSKSIYQSHQVHVSGEDLAINSAEVDLATNSAKVVAINSAEVNLATNSVEMMATVMV